MKRISFQVTTLFFTVTLLLSGCATIVSRSTSQLYIHTSPAGAGIIIINKKGKEVYKGISPTTVVLQSGAGFFSKATYQVKLSYPGFADRNIPVNYKMNGWYWGNLLIGGVIGMLIVDPATGAMWKIQDPVVDETFDKATALLKNNPTLNIVNIHDVSKEGQTHLVRLN